MSTGMWSWVERNLTLVFLGALGTVALIYGLSLPTPTPKVSSAFGAEPDAGLMLTNRADIRPYLEIDGSTYQLPVLVIGEVTPMRQAGTTGNGAEFRNFQLVAGYPGAVIGGLPLDAPPGLIPAPVLIEDCVVDRTVKLGSNVNIGNNVIFY